MKSKLFWVILINSAQAINASAMDCNSIEISGIWKKGNLQMTVTPNSHGYVGLEKRTQVVQGCIESSAEFSYHYLISFNPRKCLVKKILTSYEMKDIPQDKTQLDSSLIEQSYKITAINSDQSSQSRSLFFNLCADAECSQLSSELPFILTQPTR